MGKTINRFILVVAVAMLSACAPMPAKYPTAGDNIQSTMSSSVQNDRSLIHDARLKKMKNVLLPPLNLPLHSDSQPQEQRFDVTANDMPAKNFFLGLVAGTSYNMLIDAKATGLITLNLKNVTVDQALEAARDMYGYQYKKTDLGYEILSPEVTTEIFNINYLNVKRTGQSQTQLISTEITNSNNNSGNNSSGSTTSQTGNSSQGSGSTIITKADDDFWGNLDSTFQAGIDWKILGAQQLGATNGIGLLPNFASSGQIFSLALKSGTNFNSVINLLSEQGNVQVLSSPHISTINNQEAAIKVGSDEFFVTGYTSNITPTGSTNTTTQSVALNPFFSGITLDVTPQISRDGGVTLYIHPSISSVTDQKKTIQLASTGSTSTLTLPLALSTIRESDNIVHAENGQIVVIAGLMQNQTSETVAGLPGLSKVPMVGALARNTNQVSEKTELVILLRPVLVENATWKKQLETEAKNFQSLQRGYHAGGLSEDFGTQGE